MRLTPLRCSLLLLLAACGGRDRDADGFDDDDDCDDDDPTRHPGAVDWVGDDVDQDCDRADGVDADGDGVANLGSGGADCDDGDDDVLPGAEDDCDGVDDDCNGVVDDGPGSTVSYRDQDGDGFGLDGWTTAGCEVPAGFAPAGGDCDDLVGIVHPGATERCNGVDDDCDGAVDGTGAEGFAEWHLDDDGDGFGDPAIPAAGCTAPDPRWVLDGTDCDDADALVSPGADETCADGVDQDCDGLADESDAIDAVRWLDDLDGDGWGDDATAVAACLAPDPTDTAAGGDCDDADPGIHPTAVETCDGADDDCDALVDDADPDVDAPVWYPDDDGDGHGDPTRAVRACAAPGAHVAEGDDCDDGDATRYAGAPEAPGDGVDQDCDGADPPDFDGDGYVAGPDCDDTDPNRSPSASDVASDGIDQNCDGTDGVDLDGDGVASVGSGGLDCGDDDPLVGPGLGERWGNGLDDDCDGEADGLSVEDGDAALVSEESEGDLGFWVAGVGDLDGDGRDEVLVGDPTLREVGGGSVTGRAYLVSGWAGEVLTADATAVFEGGSNDRFGDWVGPVGDVTGDGLPDLAIAAPETDVPAGNSGTIFVWSGPQAGTVPASTADLVVYGVDADARVDRLVALDVDANGVEDLLVSRSFSTSSQGEVGLFLGPFGATLQTDAAEQALLGGTGGEGRPELVGAADTDGDGTDEVFAGVPDMGQYGGVYVFTWPVSGNHTFTAVGSDARIEGVSANQSLGDAFALADYDGDGLADLLLGTGSDSLIAAGGGQAWVFTGPFLGPIPLGTAFARFDGGDPTGAMGGSVAAAGDVDGDGAPDALVGGSDRAELLLGPFAAGVYVLEDETDATLRESTGSSEFGAQGRLAGAGDVDGNGVGDLLFGLPDDLGDYGTSTGTARLVLSP